MEVHAHTHPEVSGQRKKWTHYFWEFLMLFLAVFCGFLAENQREHMIENRREREYIKSLVKDIKNDITQIELLGDAWKNSMLKGDTLLRFLEGKEIITNSYPASRLVQRSIGFPDFISNDGTIQQLKNSGSLRLLRKPVIVDSIMAYQRNVEQIMISQQGMNNARLNSNLITDLFDMIKIRTSPEKNNIPLIKTDKNSINAAYNYSLYWRGRFNNLRTHSIRITECGNRLIAAINKEYDIN